MKRLIIFLLATCSFTMTHAQWRNYLTEEEKEVSEKTLDDAFVALNTKFVGKKWYQNPWEYWIFNQNGTCKKVKIMLDEDYGEGIDIIHTTPWTWKRKGTKITMTLNPRMITIQPNASQLAKISPRNQAECKEYYANKQRAERNKSYSDLDVTFEVIKLTNSIAIIDFSHLLEWTHWFSAKFMDELKNRKNKIEEQKKIEEEDKKKTEDLSANSSKVNNTTSSSSSTVDVTKVYDVVEQMPSFPEGQAALFSFLSNNINYPEDAKKNGAQGRVIVTFVVERDGSITDVKVVKSVDPSLDKEAQRVIKAMPHWIPGKQNGETVRAKYTTPVTFKL